MSNLAKTLQGHCCDGASGLFARLLSIAAVLLLCFSAMFVWLAPAAAQEKSYPSHPVRLVVGFPPGGGVDAVARMFADKMTVLLKQPVVVENRGGAAGSIAGKQVAAAAMTLQSSGEVGHGRLSLLRRRQSPRNIYRGRSDLSYQELYLTASLNSFCMINILRNRHALNAGAIRARQAPNPIGTNPSRLARP